jgi:hypothetical protein
MADFFSPLGFLSCDDLLSQFLFFLYGFCRAPIYRANSAWIFVGHRFTVPILHGFLSGTDLP